MPEKFTITCLILKTGGLYYTENGWDDDIAKACHYSVFHRAKADLEKIMPKHRNASIRCVIQNKAYDYYDGEDFVYNLSGAKFYAFEEAKSELKNLNAQKK